MLYRTLQSWCEPDLINKVEADQLQAVVDARIHFANSERLVGEHSADVLCNLWCQWHFKNSKSGGALLGDWVVATLGPRPVDGVHLARAGHTGFFLIQKWFSWASPSIRRSRAAFPFGFFVLKMALNGTLRTRRTCKACLPTKLLPSLDVRTW